MEELKQVLTIARGHNRYVRERIDLIASNSWISQFVRLTMASSLPNNYCIGLPGARLYGGCEHIDMMEREVVGLAKRLFGMEQAVLQFLSGMQANIGAYNAVLRPGDTVIAAPTRHGGHYSHTLKGPLRFFQPRLVELPFDEERYNVDLRRLPEVLERERPRLMILGWSEFLFPHPLAEVRALCDQYGVKLMYDMSHVVGLIAGKAFQPDAGQYADIMTSSTGKSLHAPDHGMLLYRDPELGAGILDAVMPLLTSNTHPHEVAAVGVALTELLHHGPAYAEQVVKNSKALGRALTGRGVKVLYPELGFTESHTLLVESDAPELSVQLLDRAGILCNACELPWDKPGHASGLRIGTQVLSRRGMTEAEMDTVADAVARVLVEGIEPEVVQAEVVRPLAGRFDGVAFSFDFHFPSADDWYDAPYEALRVEQATGIVRSLLPFSRCSDEEIERLVRRLDLIHVPTERVLFEAADVADSVYFVVSGAVDIVDRSKTPEKVVATALEGEHIGEFGVIMRTRRRFAARARAESRLLRMKTDDFREALQTMPSVEAHFQRYIRSLPHFTPMSVRG